MTSMSKETRRAVGRLIDTFGADILVERNSPPPRSKRERFTLQLAAEERVQGCVACPLHASKGGDTEVPLTPDWSPWEMERTGRVAVLVDAPTMQEHVAEGLGYGPLYGTIKAELRKNGIDPAEIAYLTVVACTPLAHSERRGTRRVPPDPKMAQVCRPNLMQSLDAADVDYVLLLGGHAVRAWRPKLRLDDVAGKWFLWNSRWMVFAAEHPSVMLTGNRGGITQDWRDQIARFCHGVRDQVDTEVLSGGCIKCEESMYTWDDDGVPWCEKHFKAGQATADARKVKEKDTAQGEMF